MEKPLYEEKGMVGAGKSYWSSRLGGSSHTIKIFKNQIKLLHPRYLITLNKNEITNIKKFKGLFNSGIRFYHKKKEEFPFVVFYSSDVDNLIKKLTGYGYPVK